MRGTLILVVFAFACGGSSSPRASVNGRVDGVQLVMNNAAAFVVKTSGTPTVDVLVSNVGDGCNANAGNVKNKEVLSLGVTALAGDPVDAGDYPVYDQQSGNLPQGTVVFADYHSTSGTCDDSTPPNTIGASGHVSLTGVNLAANGAVTGSFDVILQSGDRVKGTFDAPICPTVADGGVDAGCH